MTDGVDPTANRDPLFVLSFRQRDELAVTAERLGWATVAARRLDGAERRFLLSDARVAVVDARGAFEDGIAAVRALGDAVEANFAALLLLVSRGDLDRVGEGLDAGATHFLASPFGEAAFGHAVQFADRHATRLRGGNSDRDRASEGRLTWSIAVDGSRVDVGPKLAGLLGLSDREPTRDALLDALGEEGARQAAMALAKLADGEERAVFAHGLPGVVDERLVHSLTLADGRISARVERPDSPIVARDRKRRDELTGLADTRGALQWMEAKTGEGTDQTPAYVLLLLVVHRFDLINQSHGERAGDAVLQTVARRIERYLGEEGSRTRLIARAAGAEFAIGLASPATLEEGAFLARQLVAVLEHPFIFENEPIAIRIRGGVVAARPGVDDASAVLRQASLALSEARHGDGEPVHVMAERDREMASRYRQLEADLIPAIENDEIEILFQPQVAIDDGVIIGVEALSRWRHPLLGELGATALFAAAERADYLAELSAHVQQKALATAASWPDALAELRIALNVTADDLARTDFAEAIVELAAQSGVGADRVTLEITETGLIGDLEKAATDLAALRSTGFMIAIDDFGTGYSSLAYLKSLPVDYLKLDAGFSADIAGADRDRIVVRSVIGMARSLGLDVIAEGVESEEQRRLLAREGCTIYQGFLCSPPIETSALIELVARWREASAH